MGNNPSKSPSGDSSSNSGPASVTVAGVDKGVGRKPSLNAASASKAAAADPSASREIATGQPASHHRASIQKQLQPKNAIDSSGRAETPDKRGVGRIEPQFKDAPFHDVSTPVRVPSTREHGGRGSVETSGPPLNTYYGASAHLQRPPRLPLPIGDATATPGSPVLEPADADIDDVPPDRLLDEQIDDSTNLSNTTVDEDDMVDELQSYAISEVNRAVPTTIEWTEPGQKVYVTGTFVNWEKKFRLHRNNENGVMSTTLNLRPGTHHLKFIVDGDMRASDNLPTAVDFTNHLVNYIEVSADGGNRGRRVSDRGSKVAVPSRGHSPQVLPDAATNEQKGDTVQDEEQKEPEEEIPSGDFRNVIPQFLVDLDKEEESSEYQQAAAIIQDTAAPPSLPLFLGKSILNGTTPMKDDSSVLSYPNHTVLNHLATSSIKNGVLATSVTTRYKRKYVTTILYKPTSDISD